MEPVSQADQPISDQELLDLANQVEEERVPDSPLLVICSVCGDACQLGEDLFDEDVCKRCDSKY